MFLQKIRDSSFIQWLLFGLLSLLAFYRIFSFWFYHGWETSWLVGLTRNFSLINLMESHGLVSYINYLLFGWRPTGWFATALTIHVATAMLLNRFLSRKTNKTIGLVAGLLFLVTTAHHDVITWGTFESLYAVQTFCFYVGLWLFDIWRNTKQLRWYVLMVSIFVLSLVVRESGLLFLPLLLFFDIICYEKIFDIPLNHWVRYIVQAIPKHIVLWFISIGYLLLRSSFGGSANDFIDERVQFRVLLFHEHRYVEYIWRGLLAFGYFIGPYVIPYPLLNFARDLVLHLLNFPFINIYFFTFVGWVCYAIFAYTIYRLRNNRFRTYLLFCFFCFTAITIFYSFAWTIKDSFLATAYSWSENRWRYLGFTFFASGLSIFCYSCFATVRNANRKILQVKYSTFGFVLLGIYLCVNIALLNRIEDQMYRENSLPAKLFYRTFFESFPTLSSEDRFYFFRNSPGLGDFLTELNTTIYTYYPKLTQLPIPWIRSDIYYILEAMRRKQHWAEQVHFVDFNVTRGLKDYTREVRDIFSQLKPQDLSFTRAIDRGIEANVNKASPVDFRYLITLDYQVVTTNTSSEISLEKSQILKVFSSSIASVMSIGQVNVCKTMGPLEEPFIDFRKELAIDGNINNRSFWWADCRPAWISIDMGSVMTFSGAAWASTTNPDSIPRDYHYQVSLDGTIWTDSVFIKGNEQQSRIDKFPVPQKGRYLRLWVDETSFRQMLIINEFIPIFPETVPVLQYYQDLPSLYADMYSQVGSTAWMRALWRTNPDSGVPEIDRTIYIPLQADGGWYTKKFDLLEGDYYSVQGDFLNRKLSHVSLLTPKGFSVRVNHITLSSPFVD